MAISQTITDIPTPPSSSDATNFRTRADAFMASLDTLSTELNTYATQANALETNVNNKEASAVSASIIASGAANYQGDWAAGSYSIGQSVSKDGIRYISKINSNSDTPPSTNWQEIVTSYVKNYIINGGFDYWDYAISQTTSGYGSDNRWTNVNSGSTKTHSQITSTDLERGFFNSSKFSKTVVTSVAGTSNHCYKAQVIENVTKLAGKTVTISFWANADSNKNIAIEFAQVFGTGGSPSAVVSGIGSQLVALTSAWQKKTITVTIPSIVGKTLGTDGVHTSGLFVIFWFDAGSTYNARTASLGQQSGTFNIAEVKLEEGSVATPWTPYEGEFGGEVQACQRYLPVIPVGSNCSGLATATTTALITIPFKSYSRTAPTGITVVGNGTIISSVGSGLSGTTTTFIGASNSSARITTTVASGLTAGNGTALITGSILFTGCEL